MKKRKDIERKLSPEENRFLEQFLSKEKSFLMRLIKKNLGDAYDDLKDDCLSDIYWLLMRRADEIMTYRYPELWLATAVKFVSYNLVRARNKTHGYIKDIDIHRVSFSQDIFELAMYNIWCDEDIYNLLKKELTKRELQLFELMFEQGKTNKEISKILGIEEVTIRNIKKHIKDKYRDALKNKY